MNDQLNKTGLNDFDDFFSDAMSELDGFSLDLDGSQVEKAVDKEPEKPVQVSKQDDIENKIEITDKTEKTHLPEIFSSATLEKKPAEPLFKSHNPQGETMRQKFENPEPVEENQPKPKKKSEPDDNDWLEEITPWKKRREQNVIMQKRGQRNMTGIKKEEKFYEDLRSTVPEEERQGDVIYKRDNTIVFSNDKTKTPEKNYSEQATKHIGIKENSSEDKEQKLYEELAGNRKGKIDGFVFSGQKEEKEFAPAKDEYKTVKDAPEIKYDLYNRRKKLRLSLFFTVCVEIIIFCLWVITAPSLDILPRDELGVIYYGINLVCIVSAVLVNSETIWTGFKAMVLRRPDMDSAVSVAVVLSLIHNIGAVVFSESFAQRDIPIFNVVVVFGLICGLLGKYCMIKRIESNFLFVANNDTKKAIVVSSGQRAFDICRGVSNSETKVAYSKKITNVRNFIYHSFAEDPCDISGRNIALYIIPIGLIGGMLTMFFGKYAGDWYWTLTAFCGIIIFCIPVTSLLAGNFPIMRICRDLLLNKICFTGYDAVDELKRINTVALDDSDIFPEGTVTVCGLKASNTGNFENSITDISAVVIKQNGPIASVFKKIVQKKKKPLVDVDALLYEERLGISGWVENRRILVGNSEMMNSHGIWLPEIEFEENERGSIYRNVYLAAQGSFAAAFRLKYSADPQIAQTLRSMVKKGMKITVYSCDSNITEDLICEVFGLPYKSVNVMESNARHAYSEATTSKQTVDGTNDGTVTYSGNAGAMLKGILAAFRIKRITKASALLQTALNFIAFLVCCVLIITVGASAISPFYIGLYYLLGIILVVLIPSIFSK